MVKIHGLVWIIIGILMSLYTKFIQSKVQKSSLSLMFWIGVFFIGFGVFRLLISFIFKDKEVKSERKINPDLERLKQEKEKMMRGESSNYFKSSNQQDSKPNNSSNEIVSCSRCNTKHYSNSNFCHMCGYQLK